MLSNLNANVSILNEHASIIESDCMVHVRLRNVCRLANQHVARRGN